MDNGFVHALLTQTHLPSPVFCFAEGDVKPLVRKTCACLNGAGGWIVVGVDNNRHSVEIDALSVARRVQEEITSGILPLPLVYVQQEQYEDREVVLITIPRGSLAPYTYEGRYYVLLNNESTVPTADDLALLLRGSSSTQYSPWERIHNLYAKEEDLDENLMHIVFDKGISLGRLSKDDRDLRKLLSELHLLRATEIANGAVALFARETRTLLPQCRLRIQLMSRGKDSDQYDDLFFIEGNVFDVLKKAIDYFRDRLPRVAYFFNNKTGRYNDFEYPIEVLDEAISNALIHRDYTDISDEVTIFIYADRMEITNSGILPDKLVSGKNKVLPHGSVLRNPLMAEVFYVAGAMEKTGRGMLLISNTMRDAGRKLPEWTSANGRTTLRIYNTSEKKRLNARLEMFLKEWSGSDSFTKAEYLSFFEEVISDRTAKNDLALLVDLGKAIKENSGPKTSYRLVR